MILTEVHNQISTCRLCPLASRTFPVHGYGNPSANLMFIGMEPGDQEEKEGRPFIGRSGKYLREALRLQGRDLDRDCYRTNVVCCRPKDEDGTKRNANWSEVAACKDWTLAEIEAIDPSVIVLTGFTSLPLAFAGIDPGPANGLVRAIDLAGRRRLVVGLYHPAAILRNRGLAQAFARALKTAVELENEHVLASR